MRWKSGWKSFRWRARRISRVSREGWRTCNSCEEDHFGQDGRGGRRINGFVRLSLNCKNISVLVIALGKTVSVRWYILCIRTLAKRIHSTAFEEQNWKMAPAIHKWILQKLSDLPCHPISWQCVEDGTPSKICYHCSTSFPLSLIPIFQLLIAKFPRIVILSHVACPALTILRVPQDGRTQWVSQSLILVHLLAS